jgi:hypothetical protein
VKTGNKNQAVILSIVAVGAVAFLVIELMPSRLRPSALAQAATGHSLSSTVNVDLPLALVGDPFSHPKLAVKKVVVESVPAPPSDINKGNNPFNPMLGGGLGDPSAQVQKSDSAAENAGKDRQKQKGPQIALVAVMDAGTPVAMLQIDGKDGKTFKEGDKLARDVWLFHVDHSYVEIQVGHDVHRIHVGETYGGQ